VTPRATYRLQLHAGFGFAAAAAVVPYLADLGVSHVYCSPVLQAAPGSPHGYDVVDPTRLSDDLGGERGFTALCRAAAHHDLALVLDIVPNHMALAGPANRWWWDVLESGPASRYAAYFDIDWTHEPDRDHPTVLMAILGNQYGRELEAGALVVARHGDGFVVRYHEHMLPLSVESVAARGAAMEAINGDDDAVDALLAEQHYRLAWWRVASDELDYRRFFDITSLAGVRVEDPVVFEDTHRTVLDLVAAGDVAGLRVDHVDGLRDPAAYLDRLRAAAPDAWIVVEKILAADETLDASWPVAGTTGYDFAARVGDLFIDPEGARELEAHFASWTGEHCDFGDAARTARIDVMEHELAAEVEHVTELALTVCRNRRRHRDHTRRAVRTAVREVAAAFDVYRTYVTPERGAGPAERPRIDAAVDAVAKRGDDVDSELLELLRRVLTGDEPGSDAAELAVRFQQLSAPVMAKGVEDTAFYRWTPLLGVTEVGADPTAPGRGVAPFHEHNAHVARHWPTTMLSLSTHDTKRSADVRARLASLTEIASAWRLVTDGWRVHNEQHRGAGWDDPALELALYQTLVGAWPISGARVEATMLKSAREAKVHTSWRDRNVVYEEDLVAFVRRVTSDVEFTGSLAAFVAERDLVHRGAVTSLAQVALQFTSPGVPDIYQGDELWLRLLVDPDNRTDVDFAVRRRALADIDDSGARSAFARLEEGVAKLWLIRRLLAHRRAEPARYGSQEYAPLTAVGDRADNVVAFARDDLVTVVPRLVAGFASGWSATTLRLPSGSWRNVLDGVAGLGGEVELEHLLRRFPVAVLERNRA